MKVMIVTVPSDTTPSAFPPIGSLSILNYARKRTAHEFDFFNIDFHRPDLPQVVERVRAFRPDVIGISAVVSTAYGYTKKLALAIKQAAPETLVVAGGNLCASAELLLRRCHIDLCALGEGEIVFLNILERARTTRVPYDFGQIAGLAFIDKNGDLRNTGYEAPLPAAEIWDVDWEDIVRDGSFDHYFPKFNQPQHYKRRAAHQHPNYAFHEGNTDARIGGLTVAKGCVARCTFCHRWDKGIRHIPVDEVVRRLQHLYDRYNVRYFNMIAETFGADRRWLGELLDRIEPLHILWGAGGVRTSLASPELIERMKQAGCTSLIYGNETGSRKMLELMEKKVSLEENYNAAQWTVEANLGNIIQLVIGMPGESDETIAETIEYCKFGTSISPVQDPRQVSINYAQALPGTPLYEYARIHGLFGSMGMDSEEDYLLRISDRPAADPLTFINFTDSSRLTVLSWNLLIRIEVRHNYFVRFGTAHYFNLLRPGIPQHQPVYRSMLARIDAKGAPGPVFFLYLLLRMRASELFAWYPELFHRLRRWVTWLSLLQIARQAGLRESLALIKEHLGNRKGKAAKKEIPSQSLRKIVVQERKEMNVQDDPAMIPLRTGR